MNNGLDFRSLTGAQQEAVRLKAMELIKEGRSKAEVARILGVSRVAVSTWASRRRRGGLRALAPRKRGRPAGRRLAAKDQAMVRHLVVDRTPDQLKMPFYLWTRAAVGLLIEQRTGLKLSVWSVGRLLADWGFTPQKPVRRAFERDPQAVGRWLKKDYPAIARQARQAGATIYWGDEMGLRSDHSVGRSFSPKGHTPVIAGTGRRFGCNLISALTNRGHLVFRLFKGSFTAAVFIDFLRRLSRQNDQPVFLIVDSHPVHRSAKVKKWLEKNSARLRLFFLPGYCPELNPDELVNQDVKANALGRRRPATQTEMMAEARSYLRSTQRMPHIVRNYFNHPDVSYAAA
jgi:transposase